jgi:hypothetical protein
LAQPVILLAEQYEEGNILVGQGGGAPAGFIGEGKIEVFAGGEAQFVPQPGRLREVLQQIVIDGEGLVGAPGQKVLLRLSPAGNVAGGSRRGFQIFGHEKDGLSIPSGKKQCKDFRAGGRCGLD